MPSRTPDAKALGIAHRFKVKARNSIWNAPTSEASILLHSCGAALRSMGDTTSWGSKYCIGHPGSVATERPDEDVGVDAVVESVFCRRSRLGRV